MKPLTKKQEKELQETLDELLEIEFESRKAHYELTKKLQDFRTKASARFSQYTPARDARAFKVLTMCDTFHSVSRYMEREIGACGFAIAYEVESKGLRKQEDDE